MTERQEATAAPVPWNGASPWFPAVPDRGDAGTADTGATAVRPADARQSGTGYVGAPVPDGVAMSAPDREAAPPKLGGTGWPGPEPGQPGASQPPAARRPASRPVSGPPGPSDAEPSHAEPSQAEAPRHEAPRHEAPQP